MDFVEDEHGRRRSTELLNRTGSTLATCVLICSDNNLRVDVLKEHTLRIRHSKSKRWRSKVLEQRAQLLLICILVAQVPTRNKDNQLLCSCPWR